MAGEAGRDRVAEKRRRIVDAARLLFLREGVRATTMEGIAKAAGVAKPTLYTHFSDKEAVFDAILDELAEAMLAQFDAGIAGPGDAATRIGAALAGKYGVVAAMLSGAPASDELHGAHGRVADRLRVQEARMNEAVADVLRAAGVREPTELNRLVQAACYGVSRKLMEEGMVRAGIVLVCQRLIGPELSTGSGG
jgi:AcrR family transcriptional regulator